MKRTQKLIAQAKKARRVQRLAMRLLIDQAAQNVELKKQVEHLENQLRKASRVEPQGPEEAFRLADFGPVQTLCGNCGGTGGADSGGSTPWGAPIFVKCGACDGTGQAK